MVGHRGRAGDPVAAKRPAMDGTGRRGARRTGAERGRRGRRTGNAGPSTSTRGPCCWSSSRRCRRRACRPVARAASASRAGGSAVGDGDGTSRASSRTRRPRAGWRVHASGWRCVSATACGPAPSPAYVREPPRSRPVGGRHDGPPCPGRGPAGPPPPSRPGQGGPPIRAVRLSAANQGHRPASISAGSTKYGAPRVGSGERSGSRASRSASGSSRRARGERAPTTCGMW